MHRLPDPVLQSSRHGTVVRRSLGRGTGGRPGPCTSWEREGLRAGGSGGGKLGWWGFLKNGALAQGRGRRDFVGSVLKGHERQAKVKIRISYFSKATLMGVRSQYKHW